MDYQVVIDGYETFQYWLASMDEALNEFLSSLPPSISEKLDYSQESLDVLESWWLSEFQSISDLRNADPDFLVDGVSRYIGETIRVNIGGIWEISLEDPVNAYYGLPVVTKYKTKSTPICPLTLATACLDRRDGNYWSKLLINVRRRMEQKGA